MIDVDTGETTATFRSPDPAATVISFGRNATQWGDLIAVSDFDSDYGAVRGGAVHLFDRAGKHQRTLRSLNNEVFDWFGFSTTVVGKRLFVGAERAGTVYGYDTGSDSPVVTLQHPAFFSGSSFNDFEVYGDSVFAAAGGTHLPGFAGVGVVYQFDTQTGQVARTFANPHPEDYEGFGTSLALSKHGLLIGASVATDAGYNNGVGRVYVYDPDSGELLQTLVEPEPLSPSTSFGNSMTVIGDIAYIGAPNHSVDGMSYAGAVYEFDLRNGQYLGKFFSPTPTHNGRFGGSMSTAGTGLLAFGNQLFVDSYQTGEVYVYSVPEPSTAMVALIGCSALCLATRKYARRRGGTRPA